MDRRPTVNSTDKEILDYMDTMTYCNNPVVYIELAEATHPEQPDIAIVTKNRVLYDSTIQRVKSESLIGR